MFEVLLPMELTLVHNFLDFLCLKNFKIRKRAELCRTHTVCTTRKDRQRTDGRIFSCPAHLLSSSIAIYGNFIHGNFYSDSCKFQTGIIGVSVAKVSFLETFIAFQTLFLYNDNPLLDNFWFWALNLQVNKKVNMQCIIRTKESKRLQMWMFQMGD